MAQKEFDLHSRQLRQEYRQMLIILNTYVTGTFVCWTNH